MTICLGRTASDRGVASIVNGMVSEGRDESNFVSTVLTRLTVLFHEENGSEASSEKMTLSLFPSKNAIRQR